MHYDQSWMGYGIVGSLEAGAISALAGLLLFFVLHWLGRRNGWSYGPQVGWSFLLTMFFTASGDLWDLFYFNYAQLQSLQLLRAKLAMVHDPDGMGLRVLGEFIGGVIGIYVGWLLCSKWSERPSQRG